MAKESPQEGKATSISSPKPQVCCGALFLGSSSRGIWDSLLYLILTRRADAQPHAQQMERIRAPFALSPAQSHVCDAGCFREAGPCACPAQEPLYRDFTQRMKKCWWLSLPGGTPEPSPGSWRGSGGGGGSLFCLQMLWCFCRYGGRKEWGRGHYGSSAKDCSCPYLGFIAFFF